MENESPIVELETVKNKQISHNLIIGVLLFTLSIASSFASGYYLQHFIAPSAMPTPSGTPTPVEQPLEQESLETSTVIQSGKEYYDDTILTISQDSSHHSIVATATRQETENGSNQSSRVSYFDGDRWTRKTASKQYETTGIYTNNLISKWSVETDPSRLLKQRVLGSLKVDQNVISFDTGTITNNISVRSLPGFTKFMSTGKGTLELNGQSSPANILYTRIYSNNSQDIQFYETPFDLTTHWLAFWDNENNFYHVDSTHVDKPTTKYQTHQFGVQVDKDGAVSKTFDVTIDTDSNNPPNSYQIRLGSPINKTLTFAIAKSINKAPNNSYSWYMSNGSGKVDNQTDGYGVVEYIHH